MHVPWWSKRHGGALLPTANRIMATVESDQAVYIGMHLLAVCNQDGIYRSTLETALIVCDCDLPTLALALGELGELDIVTKWGVDRGWLAVEFKMQPTPPQ